MGQAKLRKAEITQLKARGNRDKDTFGLIDLMFKLGDGTWADHNRNAILDQLLTNMIANLPTITANFARGRTTEAAGCDFAFEPGQGHQLANFHYVIQDPQFILSIQEFKQVFARSPEQRILQCGYMAVPGSREIAPFFAFMGTRGNIVITKGSILNTGAVEHLLQFIPANVVARHDFDTENPAKSAAEMAKFMESAE